MSTKRFGIIVAAGSGSRLGADLPKAFVSVADETILTRVVASFEQADLHLDGGVITVPAGFELLATQQLPASPRVSWGIVGGGDTRAASVKCGLKALQQRFNPQAGDLVAVHDAARCLVTGELIERCFQEAARSGAAAPAIPVADTLRRVSQSQFGESVDRNELFAMQTPQTFTFELLMRAHEQSVADQATDDVSLVQAFQGVSKVDGDAMNFKITTAADLAIAELLLR